MNAAIVATDVVSMLFKGDTRALAYRPHITGRLLGISFMTLAELERWMLELAQHPTRYIVLPVSREWCAKWGRGFFRREEQRASDSNGWRVDSSECRDRVNVFGCRVSRRWTSVGNRRNWRVANPQQDAILPHRQGTGSPGHRPG